MALNLRRRVAKVWNSPTLMTWLGLAIRLGGLALLLPLVLTRLSVSEVLVWQMFSSITTMSMWLDFGFSPTFSRMIAFARGGGGVPEARTGQEQGRLDLARVIGTQKFIYHRLVFAALVIIIGVGTLSLMRPIAGLADPTSGWIAWALTAASIMLSLLNISNTSILIGFEQIAAMRRYESLIAALQLASTSLVVFLGGNLIAITACYSVWALVALTVNILLVRRIERGEDLTHQPFDRHVFKSVWPAAWRSGIGILFSTGIIQGSGLVMPQLASAADAAAFLLALRLITIGSQLSQAPFYTKLPAMAKARAAGNHAEVEMLAMRGMRLALWTMALGVIGLVVIVPEVLTLIGSKVQMPPPELSALLGLAFFAERYGSMHMQIYTLTNHVIWHIVNGATGVIMIIAFVILWPLVGALAMPLAMLIGYGGLPLWYVSAKSVHVLGVSRLAFDWRTAIPQAVIIIALCAYFWLRPLPGLGLGS